MMTPTRASLPLLAAIAVASALPSAESQRPTFSTRVDAVRVDVLVTENGRPLRGLGPDDFEVLDNGVVQDVTLASLEELPLSVVLALDMSGSLAPEEAGHLRDASRGLINGLRPRDEAGLITFSHVVTQQQALTADLARVREALERPAPAGGTALADAAYAGLTLTESSDNRGLFVIFSDGLDVSSWLTADQVLDSARRSDGVVYAVSAGADGPRPDFLRQLTEATGGSLLEAESTGNLEALFLGILNEFRLRYLLSYSPSVTTEGWHDIVVRVRRPDAIVKARPGYVSSRR